MTAGTGSTTGNDYPARLARLVGDQVVNQGTGGDTSTQIATRMLAASQAYRRPAIIWAGRNNFTSPVTVKADIAAMVAALGHQRYLVLSVLNGDFANEYSGQADYATLTTLNADLAAIYGTHFIDVRAYLVSLYDPNNTQDVIDHGHDIPPSSLRFDSIHLNNAGYQAVADKVYQSVGVLQ